MDPRVQGSRVQCGLILHPACVCCFLRKLHCFVLKQLFGGITEKRRVYVLVNFTLVCFHMQLFLHNSNYAVKRVLGMIIFH